MPVLGKLYLESRGTCVELVWDTRYGGFVTVVMRGCDQTGSWVVVARICFRPSMCMVEHDRVSFLGRGVALVWSFTLDAVGVQAFRCCPRVLLGAVYL